MAEEQSVVVRQAASHALGSDAARRGERVLAQSQAIQTIGERSFLAGCAKLGDVERSSVVGIIIENHGWRNAVDEMKEDALALGATHLLLVRVDRGLTDSRGFGEAYKCPARSEPQTPPGWRKQPRPR